MADARARARRAYEWARLQRAAPWALVAVPLFWAAGAESPSAVPTVALAMLLVALRWRGEALARGVGPGLLAGAAPYLFPLLTEWSRGGCHLSGSCQSSCLASCLLGGALGGAVLVRVAGHRDPATAGAALAVASLVAAVGCFPLGLFGLLAVGVLWATTAPILLGRWATG